MRDDDYWDGYNDYMIDRDGGQIVEKVRTEAQQESYERGYQDAMEDD